MDKKNQLDRILIIENSLGRTGALNSILSSTKVLSGKYQFHFLINTKSTCRALLNKRGINVHQLRFVEISKSFKVIFYLPMLILNTFHLLKIIRTDNINLLHINDMYNLLGVMAKIFNPGLKVVYHVRLLPSSYSGKLYSTWRILEEKYADQIICVSNSVAENFKRRATVIYDAIEAPKLSEKPPERKGIKLLYLANYTKGKGHDLAVEAMRQASDRLPNLKMVIYGSTFNNNKNQKYKTELGRLVKELAITDKVELHDFAEDKAHIFSEADIFLNFSNSESFSMTTLEALAYGTPAIVTDCGGPAEIIEDGISGKLVPVGDITAMADAIVELANDPQLRERFSKNGRKRCKEKFSLEEQAKKLSAVYSSLLPIATSPPWHEAQGSAS